MISDSEDESECSLILKFRIAFHMLRNFYHRCPDKPILHKPMPIFIFVMQVLVLYEESLRNSSLCIQNIIFSICDI